MRGCDALICRGLFCLSAVCLKPRAAVCHVVSEVTERCTDTAFYFCFWCKGDAEFSVFERRNIEYSSWLSNFYKIALGVCLLAAAVGLRGNQFVIWAHAAFAGFTCS